MAFRYDLFRDTMLNIKAVGGFDRELELTLLYQGKRFYYLPDTFVFDEKIQNTKDFSRQRRRWLSALLLLGFTFFLAVLCTCYYWMWGLKWWVLFALLVAALLIAVPKRFYTRRLAVALLSLPYTFLLMAANIFKLRGANKNFIHTRHGVG